MRYSLAAFSKVYLALFALINFKHVVSLLGINESMVSAPPHFSFWWWHLILLLAYGVLPLTAVLINSERLCITVTLASISGIIMESFQVFVTVLDLHYVFLLLYSLASALSLYLAVEKVSLKVAVERLSLERTHY